MFLDKERLTSEFMYSFLKSLPPEGLEEFRRLLGEGELSEEQIRELGKKYGVDFEKLVQKIMEEK